LLPGTPTEIRPSELDLKAAQLTPVWNIVSTSVCFQYHLTFHRCEAQKLRDYAILAMARTTSRRLG
jgi:hypothetical protein